MIPLLRNLNQHNKTIDNNKKISKTDNIDK